MDAVEYLRARTWIERQCEKRECAGCELPCMSLEHEDSAPEEAVLFVERYLHEHNFHPVNMQRDST